MAQKIDEAIRHGLACLFVGLLSAGFFAFCLYGYGLGWMAAIGGFIGGIYSYHQFVKEEEEAIERRLKEADRQTAVAAKRTRSPSRSLRL